MVLRAVPLEVEEQEGRLLVTVLLVATALTVQLVPQVQLVPPEVTE